METLKKAIFRELFLFISGYLDSTLYMLKSFQRYLFPSRARQQTPQVRQMIKDLKKHYFQAFKMLFTYQLSYILIYNCLVLSILDYITAVLENPSWWYVLCFFLKLIINLILLLKYLILLVKAGWWNGDIANCATNIELTHYENRNFQLTQLTDSEDRMRRTHEKIVFLISQVVLSLVLGIVFSKIPYFGKIAMIVLYSVQYSIYLFLLKWDFSKEMMYYFERNIFYFLGFGTNFSIISFIFSYSMNDGISWFVFGEAMYYILFAALLIPAFASDPPLLIHQEINNKREFWLAYNAYTLNHNRGASFKDFDNLRNIPLNRSQQRNKIKFLNYAYKPINILYEQLIKKFFQV